jgi:hypothetical protein
MDNACCRLSNNYKPYRLRLLQVFYNSYAFVFLPNVCLAFLSWDNLAAWIASCAFNSLVVYYNCWLLLSPKMDLCMIVCWNCFKHLFPFLKHVYKRKSTARAVKNPPYINEGKGATLVPGTVKLLLWLISATNSRLSWYHDLSWQPLKKKKNVNEDQMDSSLGLKPDPDESE